MMLGEFLRQLPDEQKIVVKWPFPKGSKDKAIVFKGTVNACKDTCGILLSLSDIEKAQTRPDRSIAILTKPFTCYIPKRKILYVRGEVT